MFKPSPKKLMNSAVIDLLMSGFVLKDYDDAMRVLVNSEIGKNDESYLRLTLTATDHGVRVHEEWENGTDEPLTFTILVQNRKGLRTFIKDIAEYCDAVVDKHLQTV